MIQLLTKNLLSPILVVISVWIAGVYSVRANPTNNESTTPQVKATGSSTNQTSSKVTSSLAADASNAANDEQIEQATQATEVKPGDWAYKTLQALSTKYSCANAPTGDKILSREEFATSLNSCVNSIEQLVARRKPRRAIKKRRPVAPPPAEVAPPAPEALPPAPETAPVVPPTPEEAPVEAVTQQDLDRLKELVQSFSTELQGLDARVAALDKKAADLKAQSFSTTTKLNGEGIFSISGYNTGRGAGIGANGTTANIFGDRIRLNFDTSFTGKDLLRTRLQSRNLTNFNSGVTGTNMTRLGYDGGDLAGGGFTNTTGVSLLKYNFPISAETKIITEVIGAEFNDEYYNFNPALESSGNGALSRFGRFNPVYRLSNDGAHVGVDHKFSKELGVALAYGAPNANSASNPAQGAGIFNGSNVLFGQLRFTPSEDLNLGLVYARSYHTNGANLSGGTGSVAADNPFGGAATSANHYSFLASYKVNPSFVLSGWAGFSEATREAAGGGNASMSNYAVSLAFPDFGQKGNSLAFVLGIPPKLTSRNVPTGVVGLAPGNPNTSYHLEALYRVKLSDNLSITPGIIFITNPEHNSANPTEYVGSVRTTFKF
jgi:Carbohydrate-selective porin, OprB family